MKHLFLLLISVVCSVCAYAQQAVYRTVDGYEYVALDNSRLPASVKRPGGTTIIDTGTGVVQSHTEQDPIDNTVSEYFLVSPVDMVGPNDWFEASEICKNYTGPLGGDAGLWRLPTLKETQLMWILLPKMVKLGYVFRTIPNVQNSAYYWTSTEFSIDRTMAFKVDFYAGDCNPIRKDETNPTTYVPVFTRCVRDY